MQRQTVTSAPSSEEVINLLDYLEIIAKRWRMIATVTGTAFVGSIVAALLMTNIYSSTTMILPPQQDNTMLGMMSAMTGGMASLAGDLLGKGTTSDLYVGILNSDAILDPIIDRFKLQEVYKKEYRLDTQEALEKRINISAGKKDGIISITVLDKDPKRAAAMANAFVEELGKLTVKLNITGAGHNRAYLEERLSKAKADLARAEESLKTFQARNKAVDVPEQAKASIMGVAQLKAQLAVQEVQLAGLRSRFTDSAQEVKDVKANISNLRAQIAEMEGNGRGSSIPSIGSAPELGQEYVRVMREFKTQEGIVELLTKNYEIAKLSEGKDVDGLQIIHKAVVPDRKTKPKRSLIVLATTFAAGLGAVLFALIYEAGARMPEENRSRLQRIREQLPILGCRKG